MQAKGLMIVVVCIVYGLAVCSPAWSQRHLRLGIPGNAPFATLDGRHVSGVIAQATVWALQSMGWQVTPRSLPFKRMYQWIHSGALDVAVSVLRTPERASLARYSAPIITEYTVVMVPKGHVFVLRTLADLHGKKIGGQLGFVYPQLAGIGMELIYEKDYETNLRKVAEGKLDGALIGSITGPFLARRLGVSHAIAFLPNAIGAVPLGAAFSKTIFTEDDLAAFDEAIGRLHASMEWQEILLENGIEGLVKTWPLVAP